MNAVKKRDAAVNKTRIRIGMHRVFEWFTIMSVFRVLGWFLFISFTGSAYAGQIDSLVTGLGNASSYTLRTHFAAGTGIFFRTETQGFTTSQRCYRRLYAEGATPGSWVQVALIPANGIVTGGVTASSSTVNSRPYVLEVACGGTTTANPTGGEGGATAMAQIMISPTASVPWFYGLNVNNSSAQATVAVGETYTLNWDFVSGAACTLDGVELPPEQITTGSRVVTGACQNFCV
ncbi:MAG: hypothetical protein J0H09_08655 [Burkholderiales bacterium]|nr:hypothetical protein [Burkholderiales bacterium]